MGVGDLAWGLGVWGWFEVLSLGSFKEPPDKKSALKPKAQTSPGKQGIGACSIHWVIASNRNSFHNGQ